MKASDFMEKYRIIILGILFFGLTLPLAYILNIRQDEAYSLHTTSKGLVFAFHQAISFEMQPPVYFTLLSAWRFINDSIFWARVFSILSVFLAVVLVDRLLEGKVKQRFFPVMFLLMHPVSIWAALEIRVYAFTLLTTSAYLFFFLKYYEPNPKNYRNRIIHIFLIIIGLFSYYYFGFVLAGVAFYLLITNRKLLFKTLPDFFLPVILLIPKASTILNQIAGHQGMSNPEDFSLLNLTKYWMVDFFDMFFVPVFFLGPNFAFNLFARLAFLAIILFVIIKNRHNLVALINNHFFAVSVLLVFAFSILKFILGPVFASHPHATLSLIPLTITLIIFLASLKRQMLFNAFFIGLISISFLSHYSVYNKLYKKYNVKSLAGFLHSKPIDIPVFIYTNESYEVLKYYVKDERKIFPLPKRIDFVEFDLMDWVITDPKTLDSIVNEKLHHVTGNSFIFVADNKVFIENLVEDHQKLVREYFLERFNLTDSLHIGGYSVYNFNKNGLSRTTNE